MATGPVGRLVIGLGKLQDCQIVAAAADELHAHRQAVAREADGDAEGRAGRRAMAGITTSIHWW